MALPSKKVESHKLVASPESLRMIGIANEERYADQCMVGQSPSDTNQPRVQGTAEGNSVEECRSGDLTLNSMGDTTARRTSTTIQV